MMREVKATIAGRIQCLLPFDCPNLHKLTERELRSLELFISTVSRQEPACHVIGGGPRGGPAQ